METYEYKQVLENTWGSVTKTKFLSNELKEYMSLTYDKLSLTDIQHVLVRLMRQSEFETDERLVGSKSHKVVPLQQFNTTLQTFDKFFKALLEENFYLKERNSTIKDIMTKMSVGYFKEINKFESLSYKLENQIKYMISEKDNKCKTAGQILFEKFGKQ